MRKGRATYVTLLDLAGAGVAVALMLHAYARATVLGGPLPAPPLPPDSIQLTPLEKLGKLMLYDSTLSDPPGYSCATCHVPEAGFTGPNSEINAFAGPQPGVAPGRFSDRKPQSYLYAAFSPEGPYYDSHLQTWLGRNFWDGRVPDLAKQGLQPPINPNEMANTPEGPYPPASGGYSPLLVQKLANRPYTSLFKQVYGQDAFRVYTPKQIYELFGEALAAYQSSGEVCAFSSKYDASTYGVPSGELYTLSASEERGRQLYFVRPNALRATPPRRYPRFKPLRRGKTR
jgi:cytochrome c peroxidase